MSTITKSNLGFFGGMNAVAGSTALAIVETAETLTNVVASANNMAKVGKIMSADILINKVLESSQALTEKYGEDLDAQLTSSSALLQRVQSII